MPKLNFAFFGGEPLAVPTLQKLYEGGLVPRLIISNPDKPRGRNLEISSPPTAEWAKKHNIPLIQPEKLTSSAFGISPLIRGRLGGGLDLFVVVSYGKIIPKEILGLPALGTINIHPSLLPSYRGPSPIVSAILNGDTETGVTIIKIDEEMDHGPILAQEKIALSGNEFIQDLERSLAELGGKLLVKVITEFVAGEIKMVEQDHGRATYCKKIKKEDGLIDLSDLAVKPPSELYNKFRAYANWPRTFFFARRSLGEGGFQTQRIIITDAALENGQFVIKKVLPEGKKEITWQEFNRA